MEACHSNRQGKIWWEFVYTEKVAALTNGLKNRCLHIELKVSSR